MRYCFKVKLDVGAEPIDSLMESNETIALQEISNDQKQELKFTEKEVREDLIYNIMDERSRGFVNTVSISVLISTNFYLFLL